MQSMDRSARVVDRLRVRSRDATVRSRVQMLVEEALRQTSLPGEDQGRVYFFRRLRLPALDVRELSTHAWIGRCSAHLVEMSRHAAYAAEPRAATADAVFFNSIHEPWKQLALRLIAGDLASEWFWDEATAVRSDLPTATRLEQMLDRWHVRADDWAAIARELLPALDPTTALRFIGLLRPAVVERWLGGFGGGGAAMSVSSPPRVRDRIRELLHRVRLEVEEGDRRLLLLAILAILESSPSAPQDASLPMLAARVLDEPRVRTRIERDRRGRFATPEHMIDTRIEPAEPEIRDRAAPTTSPDLDPPDTSSSLHESTPVEHRTESAGLYFLLHPLRRLGIARVVEEHPELALTHFVEHVLLELSAQAGVRDDDPIVLPLVDHLDGGRDRQRYGDRRVRLWARAVRMWCRKYARLTVAEIVSRRGRVYATPTSIDIALPMSTVDVRIRRVGLDIDPGYVPWLARVVHFHYHHEG
jgi:hypothetical protein